MSTRCTGFTVILARSEHLASLLDEGATSIEDRVYVALIDETDDAVEAVRLAVEEAIEVDGESIKGNPDRSWQEHDLPIKGDYALLVALPGVHDPCLFGFQSGPGNQGGAR